MVKVGILQFAPVLGDVKANVSQVRELVTSNKRCDLYVLPELANSGYRFNNRDEVILAAEKVQSSYFLKELMQLAVHKNAHIVTGFCEREGSLLYNSSVLIGPEGLVGVYRKLHLFMDEKDFFEPGNLGLPVYDTPIGRIGMLVCFDWMFPEAWRALVLKGAQLIAHPSNLVLPYCQSVMPSYSLVNKCFIATANRIGKERDLTFTGQSVLVDPTGEYVLKGSIDQTEFLTVEVDLKQSDNKNITPRNDVMKDRRSDVYGDFNVR
ncbi:nitrilase-related carbon-nitrogen hydrolase [Carboxylicivirga sp. N1Y90]|uniref:nitrilase-related carbon-nitrogen hydrolase n=1 Tax=Carboxylicivirga fragile TaxID=3417571 RepID=UPI003D32D85C|nr:hypothetical protein [Marinilabiliaceae bacterium N1Y90]